MSVQHKATQTEKSLLDLHIRAESREACQKYENGFFYESPDEADKSDLTLSDWSDDDPTTVSNFHQELF